MFRVWALGKKLSEDEEDETTFRNEPISSLQV